MVQRTDGDGIGAVVNRQTKTKTISMSGIARINGEFSILFEDDKTIHTKYDLIKFMF